METQQPAADRAKIMERVQKCLNLANNAGATPGEAAAALNAAQRMMEKFGITEQDLGLVGMGEAVVKISIQAGKKIPLSLSMMINLMQRAFGVKAVVHQEIRVSDPSWCVTYYGPIARVELAAYTHHVLNRNIERGWAQQLKDRPHLKGERGAKTGYYVGWVEGVSNLVTKFALGDKEQENIAAYIETKVGRLGKGKTSNVSLDGRARAAGHADSKGFGLHRPMHGKETVKIGC